MPNLILSLPVFARPSELMTAIGILVGEPHHVIMVSERTGQRGVRFTGTQGPLASLRVAVDPKPGEDPMGRARISFRAADGMRRNWDLVDDDFNPVMGKRLEMDDTPLGVAVGLRLCSVFGGALGHEHDRASIGQVQSSATMMDVIQQLITTGGSATSQKLTRREVFEDVLARTLKPLTAHEIQDTAHVAADPGEDAGVIQALGAGKPRLARGP